MSGPTFGPTPPRRPVSAADEPTQPTPAPEAPAEVGALHTGDVGGRTATGRGLLMASTLMAAGTLISRVLGLLRQSLQMRALGGGVKGDIFMMATTLPNQVYVLIAGGTLNAILVPLIVRATKEDSDKGEAYINRLITLFITVMAVTTLLCMLATPGLLHVNNPIWFEPHHHRELQNLTLLTYLTMPQIFFFGIFFIASQVLNARERFGPMMWAPIANNVVAILTFVLYLVVNGGHGEANTPYTDQQLWILGIGSTLGIVAQAACTVVFLRAAHVSYKPRFDFKGTGLGRTFHVAKWVILTVFVGFVAQTLVNMIANGATLKSDHGAGQTILAQANLIWIMPHGLITVSITTALLPAIASAFTEHNLGGVKVQTMRAIKLTNVAIIPISIALVIFAFPISQLIFGYGRGHDSVPAMAWTLAAYAIGLPLFNVSFVLARTLYALEDTRSTLGLSVIFDLFWVAMAFLFVVPFNAPEWTAPALALAYSLSNIPQLYWTFRVMRRRVPQLAATEVVQHFLRVLLATGPAALVAWAIMHVLVGPDTGKLMTLLALLAASVVAVGLYYVAARALKISEVQDTVALVLRRGRPAAAAATGPNPDDELTQILAPIDPAGAPFDREAPAPTPAPPVEAAPAEPGDDPLAVSDPEPTWEDPDAPIAKVATGMILADRYRLTQFLNRRGTTQLWRAYDDTLSRQVLLHIMRPDNPRAPEILAAARRAATATDSRYLRVLDAVHSTDPDVGAYIVCEHVVGQSLTELLDHGALSALEAGWVVREVADALGLMHAQNLYHGRLNPDTVVITNTGNVKIVGFGIEAALFPHRHDEDLTDLDWAAADVESLGKLLYACLIARWPGGNRYGMPAAPKRGEQWLTPAQVRAGISPALDQICDQILSRPPRNGLPALRSANDVMVALTRVLGSANASGDLERRVTRPQGRRPSAGSAGSAASAASAAPAPRPAPTPPPVPQQQFDTPVPAPVRAAQRVEEPLSGTSPGGPKIVDGMTVHRERRGKLWVSVLVALVAVALLFGVLATVAKLTPGAKPTPSPTAAALHPIPIVAAKDYDPEGSGGETPGEVDNVFDGNPDTFWHTEVYRSATLGNTVNKKTGVGIYVDLGSVQQVSQVKITTAGVTNLQLRVPPDGTTVPQSSAAWTTVATKDGADGSVTLTLAQPARTRYVLVWLTSLPQAAPGQFQGAIGEIEVLG